MKHTLKHLISLVILIAFLNSKISSQSTDITQKSTEENKIQSKEIWVRLENFEIPESSSIRQANNLNNPPRTFIICQKNGVPIFESQELNGWARELPTNYKNEFLIEDNFSDSYTVEVWDKQLFKSKKMFTIGPLKGSELKEKLIDPDTKSFVEGKKTIIKSNDDNTSITVSFNGIRVWYRLVNINIPDNSSHRNNMNINHPPSIYVGMRSDGGLYGSYSSSVPGWNVDFPKEKKNCWAIREGTQRKYTIEIWDNQKEIYNLGLNPDNQILTIPQIHAEAFRKPIFEKINNALFPKDPKDGIVKDRSVSVTFEKIEKPIE